MDDTDADSDENLNPSAESNFCWDMSAILDAVDEFDMYGRLRHRTVLYEKADGTILSDFPANIKLKEDMQIKDVAKDHVFPFLPAKSLLRFRSVSKEWDQWIGKNPFLAHRQSCYF